MPQHYDTVIIGGGPGGSTVASVLRKYDPSHRVLVLERETFPRDHVGESQLPLICVHLNEIGAWDKVEAAGFPIKIGATYRWGSNPDLWYFNFLAHGKFEDQDRPSKFEGDRSRTAFQVDRSIYDKILLDHSESLGAEVRQNTKVVEVLREGDLITGLRLEDGSTVTGRHYVDASGAGGLLRRAMEVESEYPTTLRNIAIWDYWQNAKWSEQIGIGGTRIVILSLGYGWLWFIPIGPTRTSVGLVLPAAYYKASGKRPAELYAQALQDEPWLRTELMVGAESEDKLQTTNDWSYIADRLCGENWFLVGDACGFADPILSAGMTLAHSSAREVAYTILELDRGELDAGWMKSTFQALHRRRIRQHIQFADYWYAGNGCSTDLKAYTSELAKQSGLDLDPEKAFNWLSTGGFANDDLGQASLALYGLKMVKQLLQQFSGVEGDWLLNKYNELRLDLVGVRRDERPTYRDGRIHKSPAFVRGDRVLPLIEPFKTAIAAVQNHNSLAEIIKYIDKAIPAGPRKNDVGATVLSALEGLLAEGWIKGRVDPAQPVGLGLVVHKNSAGMEFAGLDKPQPDLKMG